DRQPRGCPIWPPRSRGPVMAHVALSGNCSWEADMDERSSPCRTRREGVQSTGHPHPSRASLLWHSLFSGCKTLHVHVSVILSKSSTETQHCPLPPMRAITSVHGCLRSTTDGLRR